MGKKLLVTTMPDESKWGVDVHEIALNRADYYKHEFGGDINRSLNEDTLPLFKAEPYEIEDWAVNNMNWEDFDQHFLVQTHGPVDYEEGWCNGHKKIEQF